MRRAAPWMLAAGLTCSAGHPAAASGETKNRHFVLTASRFQFEPSHLEVEAGDVVELVLHSLDTEHGIAIEAFGVKTVIPKGGAAVTVSFLADRAGRYTFKCSEYCGSGHKRMKGELVVEEARR
jgi:cytochrome c oxidase subunit II